MGGIWGGKRRAGLYLREFLNDRIMKMKRKLMEVDFEASGKGDYVAKDGEVESCVATDVWLNPDPLRGLGVGEDITADEEEDTLYPLDTLIPQYAIPPGYRLICTHSGCSFHPGVNLIMQNSDGALFYASASTPSFVRPIPTDGLLPEVTKGVAVGDTVALLSSRGLDYIMADPEAEGYLHSSGSLPRPVVEFAMVRRPVEGYSLLPSEWPSGEIIVDTAASDPDYRSELAEETERFRSVLEARCAEAGLFTAPFLVMTALRLADGTRLPVSSPVLMIPNSESPTLRADSSAENPDNVRHTISWLGRACRLEMRILRTPSLFSSSGDENRRMESAVISGLEILATPQVKLRDDCRHTGISLRTVEAAGFSRSVETTGAPQKAPVGEGNNHRHDPTYGEDFSELGGGGDENASDGTRIRGFVGDAYPRAYIEEEISRLDTFHSIAFIPWEDIPSLTSTLFTPVPLSTSLSSLSSLSTLSQATDIIPDFGSMTHLIPDGIGEVNSRLAAFGGSALPPAPSPLRGSVSFSGHTAGGDTGYWNVGIEVTIRKNGKEVTASVMPQGNSGAASPDSAEDIADTLPRWIFYPDPDACRVRISAARGSESRTWTLRLQPHPSLHGAVWFRGLGPDLPKESSDSPGIAGMMTTSYPTPHTVGISPERVPWVFPTAGRISAGERRICGVAPTVRSLSAGRLGEFPYYLITDGGVWAIAVSEEGIRSVQPVSLYGCINPDSVLTTPHGTIFSAAAGPVLLDGTKSTLLPLPDFYPDMKGWHTRYDAALDILILYPEAMDRAIAYSFGDKRWRESSAASLPDSPAEEEGSWQVTLRPLKLIAPHTRQRVWGAICGGSGMRDIRLRLWGAMRPDDWHPIAEGENPLRGLAGSGWRYWRLQVLFRAADPRDFQYVIFTVRGS